MRFPIWSLEWRVAGRRRRLLAWNVAVPIVLLLPVALSPAAAPHRAAVYSLFIAFFGIFGGGIPLLRDRTRGWTEKIGLTGYPPPRWMGERIVAMVAIDLAQLAPALALVFAVAGASPAVAGWALLSVALALLAGNAVGALVARFVGSLAEAALVCGTVALFLLHFAGAFRTAAPGSWEAWLERWSPFRPLIEAMEVIASGGGVGLLQLDAWLPPTAGAAAVLSLAVALAPRLARGVPAGD